MELVLEVADWIKERTVFQPSDGTVVSSMAGIYTLIGGLAGLDWDGRDEAFMVYAKLLVYWYGKSDVKATWQSHRPDSAQPQQLVTTFTQSIVNRYSYSTHLPSLMSPLHKVQTENLHDTLST